MVDEQSPTTPRADERLPTDRLEPYLREHLPNTDGEMHILQFPGGRANLTYLVQFGEIDYVLRRPPLGPVAPSAHDMGREYRILSKLSKVFDLAPDSYLFCDDETIIGAPFQMMERRQGLVIRTEIPAQFDSDNHRRCLGEMVVDVLAQFHLVDRDHAGLSDLGRPEGFVERQLTGWSNRWQKAAHEENPNMLWLIEWLANTRPASKHVTLLHNDYKLDNMLVSEQDPSQCVAILDWDMCTSGDPLMDLSYLLNQWAMTQDPPDWIEVAAMPTHLAGFATRTEVIERYARKTGFDVGDIHWYVAFSAMKFAVIIQQIFIRYFRGQTQDDRFADFDRRAAIYIDKARHIAEHGL